MNTRDKMEKSLDASILHRNIQKVLYLTTLARWVPSDLDPDHQNFQKKINTKLIAIIQLEKLTLIDLEAVMC